MERRRDLGSISDRETRVAISFPWRPDRLPAHPVFFQRVPGIKRPRPEADPSSLSTDKAKKGWSHFGQHHPVVLVSN